MAHSLSLPNLKPEEAKNLMSLYMSDERFKWFWRRIQKLVKHWETEALDSTTSRDRREVLVQLRETVNHEILDLINQAADVMAAEEKALKQKTGQAMEAPV